MPTKLEVEDVKKIARNQRREAAKQKRWADLMREMGRAQGYSEEEIAADIALGPHKKYADMNRSERISHRVHLARVRYLKRVASVYAHGRAVGYSDDEIAAKIAKTWTEVDISKM